MPILVFQVDGMESPSNDAIESPEPSTEVSSETANDPVPYLTFTLDPDRLSKHLATPLCSPTADQIITQLALRSEKPSGNVEVAPHLQTQFVNSDVSSRLKRSFRTTALRVFAFYKWDLAMFSKTVPLHLVNLLLNELILITDEQYAAPINNVTANIDVTTIKSLSVSAKVFYHYWCLKVHLESKQLAKPPAVPMNVTPNMVMDPRVQYSDQMNATLRMMSEKAELNADQLDSFLNNKDYRVENYFFHSCDTLNHLNSSNQCQLFSFTADHVLACVNFCIGKLKFRKMEMTQAKTRFEHVRTLMKSYQQDEPICSVFRIDQNELWGFCVALGIDDLPVKTMGGSCSGGANEITLKLLKSVSDNEYRTVVDLLLQDNSSNCGGVKNKSGEGLDWNLRTRVVNEMPEKSQFKFQATVCNIVYSIVNFCGCDFMSLQCELGSFYESLGTLSATDVAFMLMVFNSSTKGLVKTADDDENFQKASTHFLTKFLLSIDSKIASKLLTDNQPPICDVLSNTDCKRIASVLINLSNNDIDDFESSLETPVKSTDSSLLIHGDLAVKRMVVLENEILMEPTIEKTRELLNEYTQMPNSRPIIVHLESWIPKIWQDRIKNIATHDNYYRSFAPLALGKGFRFLSLEEYRVSHDWFLNVAQLTNQMLGAAAGQPQPFTVAFEWEALHARLNDAIRNDQQLTEDLIQKCVATLYGYLGNGSLFDIRSEIVETCVISLLNCGCFKPLSDFTQFGLKIVRVGALLAKFKQHMVLFGIPKFEGCKDMFGLVLEFHKSSFDDDSKKPKLVQPPPDVSVDRPVSARDNFLIFCSRLTDVFVIDTLLTCLVRLYNVLNSENLVIELTSALLNEGGGAWRQLFIEHENLPNAGKIVSSIERTLEKLLNELLYRRKDGMANVKWVKTFMELQIAKEKYLCALKTALAHGSYVTSGFTYQTPSNRPPRTWNRVWSDEVLSLMIRCCEKLSFNVMAAVFAQMMFAPQYEKVFSLLGSDAARITRDSGDELYRFIYDKCILECIINAHSSRGELQRADIAIEQMKNVDLNEYNSTNVKNCVANVYSYKACQLIAKFLL